MTGLRPVAELMFADFAGVAFDQIANQVAKYRYMSGGQADVPVTIRMASGAGLGFAAQHSQATENWFLNVPGCTSRCPRHLADVYGLLRARSAPTTRCSCSNTRRCSRTGGRSSGGPKCRSGWRRSLRPGGDVTVVATQLMRAAVDGRRARDGVRRHRGRSDRPAHARPPRPRDHRRIGRPDRTPRLRAGIALGGRLGGNGHRGDHGEVPSTTSTRRLRWWQATTRRSPTRAIWRTDGCRRTRGSPTRCGVRWRIEHTPTGGGEHAGLHRVHQPAPRHRTARVPRSRGRGPDRLGGRVRR